MLPVLEKAASFLGLSQRRASRTSDDAREQHRFPANEPARVFWKGADNTDESMEVMVVNVSVRGMAFLSTVPFERGDWLTLKTAERSLDAVVRHARAIENCHAIGIEVYPPAGGPLQQSLRRLSAALSGRRGP